MAGPFARRQNRVVLADKFDGMGKTISKPAPRLGEHTDVVLKSLLKMAESELKALREQGAIK